MGKGKSSKKNRSSAEAGTPIECKVKVKKVRVRAVANHTHGTDLGGLRVRAQVLGTPGDTIWLTNGKKEGDDLPAQGLDLKPIADEGYYVRVEIVGTVNLPAHPSLPVAAFCDVRPTEDTNVVFVIAPTGQNPNE